jgi:hypothetical protein
MRAIITEIKKPEGTKNRSSGIYEKGYFALTTPPFMLIED